MKATPHRTLLSEITLVAGLALSLLQRGAFAQAEAEKLLQSKDPADRIKGIEAIVANAPGSGEETLRKAVKDKDFEVMLRAVQGLGSVGTPKSTKFLIDMALGAPLQIVRRAAAKTLAKIDEVQAAQQLASRLKGSETLPALEAMAHLPAGVASKALVKLLKSEDTAIRRAAALALGTTSDATHLGPLQPLLKDADATLVVAAAKAIARLSEASAFDVLLAHYSKASFLDVVERGLATALADHLRKQKDPAASLAASVALCSDKAAMTAARGVRLLHALAREKPPLLGADGVKAGLIEAALVHEHESVRAAAAFALGGLQSKDAVPLLEKAASTDSAPRVRIQALRALAAIDAKSAEAPLVLALKDKTAAVREEAAVLIAKSALRQASPALLEILADSEWSVVLSGAVSLGRLQHEGAIQKLTELSKHSDWKWRAAGAAGLGRGGWKEAVPVLIERLSDQDPVVKATAHHFLQTLTREKLKPDAKLWAKWWQTGASSFGFEDRFASQPKSDGYDRDSFRRNPYGIFKDIDVIVLTQERDHLQTLLQKLDITHALTRSGQIATSGLHPDVAFMVNCPGNILGDDSERLSWLVRSGGHLISSCWGLTNTVAKTFPGFISAMPQGKSPPGAVEAFPAAPDSPYLKDVFDESTQPLYQLAGYQLITVHDRERVEVLIESPEAATSFGEGNLAAHFSVGHGEVFQSTNHFALQGMKRERFKTEEERTVYAIERLGFSFEKIRELQSKGTLKDQSKAEEACDDLTILRLVARFVQMKRLASK